MFMDAGHRSPDFHMSSLMLRKISLTEATVRPFFEWSMKVQERTVRQHSGCISQWSPDAKRTLGSVKVCPPNLSTFKLTNGQATSLQRSHAEALETKLTLLITVSDPDSVLREAFIRLFNASSSSGVAELAIPLLLVSGRRTAEILNGRSKFEAMASSPFHALFTGQLKKGGEADDETAPYGIPLLVPFPMFDRALTLLRERQTLDGVVPSELSQAMVHCKYQKLLSRAMDRIGDKRIIPSLPLTDCHNSRHMKPHDLRATYVSLVSAKFHAPYAFAHVAMRVLGHASPQESLHYSCVRLGACVDECFAALPSSASASAVGSEQALRKLERSRLYIE
jgi:hypothetical protein